MIALLWSRGLIRRRLGRLLAVSSAIALVVGLVAVLGSFVVFARSEIARRAVAATVVDWQIKLAPGATPQGAIAGLRPLPGVRATEVVGYGDVLGFESSSGGTVQTTGTGVVVGLPASYRATFPTQVRDLIGANGGVLLAQQTAANLHAGPGDEVLVKINGRASARVIVDGIVDLPNADSFFQSVGSAGAGPQAPPDNVLIVPMDRWRELFDPSAGSGTLQVHARLGVHLPADPAQAFTHLVGERRNYEVRMAGAATVGDNLAAHLDAARKDAAYGQLLILFLGLPGVAVGIALAVVGAAAGLERRRAEQALLRARGASLGRLVRVSAVEAAIVGLIGLVPGLAIGVTAGRAIWHVPPARTWGWFVVAATIGLVSAAVAVLVPAIRDARTINVVSARKFVRAPGKHLWRSVAATTLVIVASVVVWVTTRQSYQVVVATEGVPSVSISYISLLGPAFAWIAGLLVLTQLAVRALTSRRTLTARLVRPVAGGLSGLVAGWLAHLRPTVVRSVLLVGLAVAFAVSTATFDSTFSAQSRVDAELTNGADVTVSTSPGIGLGGYASPVSSISGVRAVESMQHRFAYVGNDLQDLYGIRPRQIGAATTISDAYFAGGHAAQQLDRLASTPDGVFISDETVKDFQLHIGDQLRLRLLDASSHAYTTIPFHVVGVVREFPTAPTDSFLVANASYISRVTNSDAAETLLVRTAGRTPPAVAAAIRRAVPGGIGAQVRDIVEQRRITATGLVALDMRGLSAVNLMFGGLATVWAVGLLLGVGFAERKRNFVILRALGGRSRHVAAFVLAEAGAVVAIGSTAGFVLGGAVAWILVRVLQGVFDPPPAHPVVPWGYVAAILAIVVVGLVGATAFTLARSARLRPQELRDHAL